jgi:hypothetical protein
LSGISHAPTGLGGNDTPTEEQVGLGACERDPGQECIFLVWPSKSFPGDEMSTSRTGVIIAIIRTPPMKPML